MNPLSFLIISQAVTDFTFEAYLLKIVKKNIRNFFKSSGKTNFNRMDIFDPTIMSKFLSSLPKTLLDILFKQVGKAKKQQVGKQFGGANKQSYPLNLNEKAKAQLQQQIKNSKTQQNVNGQVPAYSWLPLSSSWVRRGIYQPQGPKNGLLTIMIFREGGKKWYGPYTYPNVPVEMWNAMLSAKGSHGTGAGTVMWRMWLRKWLPSKLRKFIRERVTDKSARKGRNYAQLSQEEIRRGFELINNLRKIEGNRGKNPRPTIKPTNLAELNRKYRFMREQGFITTIKKPKKPKEGKWK